MKAHPPVLARRHNAAFTLVEMLMVIGIMTVLFVGAAAGMKKSWGGQELRASSIQLAHDIALASQTAVKLNRPVELRFYKYHSMEIASEEAQYFAWQIVVQEPSKAPDPLPTTRPLFELQRCLGSVVIAGDGKNGRFSTLLPAQAAKRDERHDPDLGIGEYEYVSVEFRPSGRTNLDPDPSEPWTITFIPVSWLERSETPKDYQTLSIEPNTGAVRIW